MAAPPRICVPIVSASQDIASVEPLADLFEVRIDLIGRSWRKIVPRLEKPWLACNRRAEEGGKWKGTEAKRTAELFSALELGADYIDIELGAPGAADIVKDIKGRAEVIVSYHDFKETPPVDRLRQIVINELAAGADICKVVTTAHSVGDNIAVLELFGLFPDTKIVAFAMGAEGQISRLMCPMAGGCWTWASAKEGRESAAGQMAAGEIIKLYRMVDD